ncbi:MAG TPA: DUF29 domain-containing protein [Cyanobacteria bacterium UBA8156]|jgi:hypothetical protein|nr:DUF29 domain-containing protein [Cyanobacteria bacterium UBA8156]
MTLYDRDFVLWTEDTMAKLRAGDFAQVDMAHLLEEVDGLGKSQRHAMRSLWRRLLEHLLKRCCVPFPECYRGWEKEIRNFRNDIEDLLADSPSLRGTIAENLPTVFHKALATVQEEYPQIEFPDTWLMTYSIEELLTQPIWEKKA